MLSWFNLDYQAAAMPHQLEAMVGVERVRGALLGIGVGVLITAALMALRSTFVGFPLHPAAYVLNMSFANDLFWCDMFVAWALKSLLLHYGGMKMYRMALPFFLGLILGDFVTGAVWSLIGTALHIQLFRTFAT